MFIQANDQGVGAGGGLAARQLAGEGVVQAHVVPLHQGAGVDRCQLDQHHLPLAHGVLEAPDGGVDAGEQGKTGQQKGEASHEGLPL
jgi:hypothetical protein